MIKKILLSLVVLTFFYWLPAQKTTPTIKKEADVRPYELPQLLITLNGKKINTPMEWERFRRPEILSYFSNQVYGAVPAKLSYHNVEGLEVEPTALGGKAIRKQINLNFKKGNKSISISLLIYLPSGKTKSPVFLAYNFKGNYSVNDDPAILINGKKESELSEEELKKFNPSDRGGQISRWAIDKIIDAGYGLVTADYLSLIHI